MKETLARVEAQEERVLARVEHQVKEMVKEQLKVAGFDSQLSAGDLSTVRDEPSIRGSYAAAAASAARSAGGLTDKTLNKEQRQEEKFWDCRRALRIWPVPGADEEGLRNFLKDKLAMDATFIEEDLGPVVIKRNLEKRPRNKDEICVYFENKQVRDHVKAKGPNLANYREEAGMRLQIPDHLQKDFRALMSVAYDLKKKNPDLRRNVKFDEESLGLYMDVCMEKDGSWKRIRPTHAYRVLQNKKTEGDRMGPADMDEDEIRSLLGDITE